MRRNTEQPDPPIPDGVSADDLDRSVRAELKGLTKEHANDVAAHLAAVAVFIDEDPERAWRHAITARRKAARLGIVRETAGLAAYHSGRYADALSELRTARRLTGSNAHLAVMADSERGLGRPQRALDLARGPEAKDLDGPTRIELLIVEAGARHDLDQDDAAVVTLQVKELDSPARTPSVARLRHAYAEALARVNRVAEAESWFAKARHADRDGTALAGLENPADFAPGEIMAYDEEILDLLDDSDGVDDSGDDDDAADSRDDSNDDSDDDSDDDGHGVDDGAAGEQFAVKPVQAQAQTSARTPFQAPTQEPAQGSAQEPEQQSVQASAQARAQVLFNDGSAEPSDEAADHAVGRPGEAGHGSDESSSTDFELAPMPADERDD